MMQATSVSTGSFGVFCIKTGVRTFCRQHVNVVSILGQNNNVTQKEVAVELIESSVQKAGYHEVKAIISEAFCNPALNVRLNALRLFTCAKFRGNTLQ
jgi:hypothetical protein